MNFNETQQAMETVVRDFCRREIEPAVLKLESGEISPFEIMRSVYAL